jgi:hypothetical protein
MIKQNSNNVTIKARYLTYNHSIKKFCMKNILTNQRRVNQTLVVTPSNDKNTIHMPKIILPSVAPQLQEPIIQDKRLKRDLSQESEFYYSKMRGNVLSLYNPNDL